MTIPDELLQECADVISDEFDIGQDIHDQNLHLADCVLTVLFQSEWFRKTNKPRWNWSGANSPAAS